MSEPEVSIYVLESVNRCVEAYRRQGPGNHDRACQAFLAELPILSGPAGVHAYLACIGKAMSLGVIDLLDVGRYCHLAQISMRAWKLAQPAGENTSHPLPHKGNHFDARKTWGAPEPSHLGTGESRQAPEMAQDPTPLPPNGNHPEDDPNRIAAAVLPDFDTQKAMYKSLRQMGFPLPSNSHLRKNPVEALLYCDLANTVLNQRPSAGDTGCADPGPTPSHQQVQAA